MSTISKAEKTLQAIRDQIVAAENDLQRMKALTNVLKENQNLRDQIKYLKEKLTLIERTFSLEADVEAQQIIAIVKRVRYELNK